MKIGISRTAGAVALASALVVSGLVLAAAPSKKPSTSAVRGQAAEYASMCRFCETATKGACYAYDRAPSRMASAFVPGDAGIGSDAGMNTEGACTYPPCAPTEMLMLDGGLAEFKLACASCRALCPNTSGGPERPAAGKAEDQQR
jgi:hypothetical protein